MFVNVKKYAKTNKMNRVAKVFVSSTFQNVENERKFLAENVFPFIQAECNRLGVEFVPIDLRWGITAESSENGKTLEICLKEIDRSRPFFICLLGDRYGSRISALPGSLSDSILKDFPVVKQYVEEDISVTEAEIRYGVLDLNDNSKDKINAHFWIRKTMEPDEPSQITQAVFQDQDNTRLQSLKERVKKNGYFPVDEYDSLAALGKKVKETLMSWIHKTWSSPKELTWFEKQEIDQVAFERSRQRNYIPNPRDYKELNKFINSSKSNVMAVIGKSGLGKSSLLTNWAKHFHKKNPDSFILTHYVSASEGSDLPSNILRRLTFALDPAQVETELSDVFRGQLTSSQILEELTNKFILAVDNRAGKLHGSPLVIIIDGLNQLSECDNVKDLAWIPILDKVKIVVSTVDSDKTTYDAIKRRAWKQHKLHSLSDRQKSKIIEKTLKDRGRELSSDQFKKIFDSRKTSNPIALNVLLNELCCIGDFSNLNSEIAHYLESSSMVEFLTKVLQRVEKSLTWLGESFDNNNVVSTIASLIATSRYGLTNKELCEITGYKQIAISTFVSIFDAYLVESSGRYSFSHNYIKKAIKQRYDCDSGILRERLVDYFTNLGDFNRLCQEVPFQLSKMKEWERLNNFLIDGAVLFKLHDGTLTSDYCQYVESLISSSRGKYNMANLLKINDSTFDELGKIRLWTFLGHLAFMYEYFDVSEKAYSKALLLKQDVCQNCSESNDINCIMQLSALATSLTCVGVLHSKIGKMSSAEEEFKESSSLWLFLGQIVPRHFSFEFVHEIYKNFAESRYNLAVLYIERSKYSEAEKELIKIKSLYRKLASVKNATSPYYKTLLALTLNALGNIHSENPSRYSEAEAEYKESFSILHSLNSVNPNIYASKIAIALSNLGSLHQDMGNYADAKRELSQSLSLLKSLALLHPRTFDHEIAKLNIKLGELASCELLQGKKKLTKDWYEDGLSFYHDLETDRGNAYNLEEAKALCDRGIQNIYIGNYSDAKSFFSSSLKIFQCLKDKAKDPVFFDSHIAQVLYNWGVACLNSDENKEAETKLLNSLELFQKSAENDANEESTLHISQLGMVYFMLGVLYSKIHDYVKAEIQYNECFILRKRLTSIDFETYAPDLATLLFSFGNLFLNKNEYASAEGKYKESLDIRLRLAKSKTSMYSCVVESLLNLAVLHSYFLDECQDEAQKELVQCIDLCQNHSDILCKKQELLEKIVNLSLRVAEVLGNKGSLSMQNNHNSDAEIFLSEAISLYRALINFLGADENFTFPLASLLELLGNLYLKTGDYTKAEATYKESLSLYYGFSSKDFDIDVQIMSILFCLSSLYLRMNKPISAKKNLCEFMSFFKTCPRDLQKKYAQRYEFVEKLYESLDADANK